MGVPAFYRWLSEKYPKIIQDVLEERVHLVPNSASVRLPFDATLPNPSGLECDNLYIDMNGIIHPCSHPEVGPQPTSEEEMYENVCLYIDRLVRVIRPRQMLYLAIDGVAPRAKMNQQRSRRFRSAQEARELVELESHIREELVKAGQKAPPTKKAWDSNVITPGTPFMINLATYLRFYIRKRISQDKAWRYLRIIFSDASLPGEGEHKIMSHIRLQRAQPGFNANQVHVLHGLDADLIMLALATHEAHFYISREEVLFGRKSQEQQEKRQLESGFRNQQRVIDERAGAEAMQLPENMQKPLQRISIPILREYLANEFQDCITPGRIPFTPSLERLIDDIVFLCFFVGNDFLPHLPSLDIRDGALDYLFNVYKRLLPGLGDYITKSGGNVNLSHVDVLLAEVGAIEDYVFSIKYENEKQEQHRREEQKVRQEKGANPHAPPVVMPHQQQHKIKGRAASILEQGGENSAQPVALTRRTKSTQHDSSIIKVSHKAKDENSAVAQALKESLGAGELAPASLSAPSLKDSNKRLRENTKHDDVSKADLKDIVKKELGTVGEAEDEFDADEDDDDDEEISDADVMAADVDKPKLDDFVDVVVDPEAAKIFKQKVKCEQQKKLDKYAKEIEDTVRLHEAGWKDRYYSDKCKADDVNNHGGREHLFRSYVMGLCWVMKYYYDGCPSWKWYYPFHYGPFASDLKNIERFEKDAKSFEQSTPFNPVEQLLAVLPSDSAHAVPKASRWLMTDRESPIIDFYPTEVPVDPNGKAMPWLWVVLLPFIEEDRLLSAMSPTMAKWSQTELLCNARGLDDGYLYVHKDHGLTQKLVLVLQRGKIGKESKAKLTDAAVYGCPGFSGAVRPPLSNELHSSDEDILIQPPGSADKIANHDRSSIFAEGVVSNDAVCVAFTEPSKLSHKSILLPGVILATPILTADDKRIRRPRLNRGGESIANMGLSNGQSYKHGHGSMNISTYERNLSQETGRGNDMYRTGNRAWGAMEPVPKRRNLPPQITNPFISNHGNSPQFNNPQSWQSQQQWNSGSGTSFHQQNQPYHGPPQQQQPQGHQSQQQPTQQIYRGPPSYPPPPQRSYDQQRYQNASPHSSNSHRQPPPPPPPPPYKGNGFAGYNHGRGFMQNGLPYSQPQGIDFRMYNTQVGRTIEESHQPRSGSAAATVAPLNEVRRSRASADVMNHLRAQLTQTLHQNRSNTSRHAGADQSSQNRR